MPFSVKWLAGAIHGIKGFRSTRPTLTHHLVLNDKFQIFMALKVYMRVVMWWGLEINILNVKQKQNINIFGHIFLRSKALPKGADT